MSVGGYDTDLRVGWLTRFQGIAGRRASVARGVWIATVVLALWAPGRSTAQSAEPVDFARDIAPVFAKHCHACHGPEKQQGGLRLDIRDDALAGGDSGRAIEPKSGAASLLYELVSGQDPDRVMPPKGPRLDEVETALIRRWIDEGAVWPNEVAGAKSQSTHWAFQPIRAVAVPDSASLFGTPVHNPIDEFVRVELAKAGLEPSPEADRTTLLRRLSLDLTGLPPTPERVAMFVDDRRPDAYDRLVDELLASPHFGERWGRYWLDLARYADSDGYEKDSPRPFAYRYRDWVIDAINADIPFDRFTIEQLAGDLLETEGVPPEELERRRVATGFHRNTLTNKEGGADQEEFRVAATIDRVNTLGGVWFGLTLGCAQCHTHKYDPITQREYYQLFAFFNSIEETNLPVPTEAERLAFPAKLLKWQEGEKEALAARQAWETENTPRLIRWWLAEFDPVAPMGTDDGLSQEDREKLAKKVCEADPAWMRLDQALAKIRREKPTVTEQFAQVVSERSQPRETRLLVRGDFLRPADAVSEGTPKVLHKFEAGAASRSTRLDLAKWVVSPDNPLTPRVVANQWWTHLFGRGLVGTPDDFGTRGERASHPELLDWLARWLVDNGWSRKEFVRFVVSSHAYRQASRQTAQHRAIDPRNKWLSRQNRWRVEAETVRDVALATSELLQPKIGGPSVRPPLPAGVAELGYAGSVKWAESSGADRYRRGLYIFFQRTVPYPMLMAFDSPDSNTACVRRERSNTPIQALTLLNDPVFVECAEHLGRGAIAREPQNVERRVRDMFVRVLSREPSADELAELVSLHALLRSDRSGDAADERASIGVARVLLNLDEALVRE